MGAVPRRPSPRRPQAPSLPASRALGTGCRAFVSLRPSPVSFHFPRELAPGARFSERWGPVGASRRFRAWSMAIRFDVSTRRDVVIATSSANIRHPGSLLGGAGIVDSVTAPPVTSREALLSHREKFALLWPPAAVSTPAASSPSSARCGPRGPSVASGAGRLPSRLNDARGVSVPVCAPCAGRRSGCFRVLPTVPNAAVSAGVEISPRSRFHSTK